MNRFIFMFFWFFAAFSSASILAEVKAELLVSDKIEELLRKGSCWGCHGVDETRVGPSYRRIAARYSNANNQQINILTEKIRHGGAGNWGVVPMIPISQLASDEIYDLVEWVLEQN